MAVSVRKILETTLMRQADPSVEAGEGALSNAVRWAYASERYDVASFLSGGELVIAEGSALFARCSDGELERYVRSLAGAGVSAFAMELVEGLRTVPPALLREAERLGLPVIGLHARQPFVDLCQSVNTEILRDQFEARARIDVLSSELHASLSKVRTVDEAAAALSQTLGESVAIFDADGLPLAQAGYAGNVSQETAAAISVSKNGRPLATVEITQRLRAVDGRLQAQLAEILQPLLAALVPLQVPVAIASSVFAGPAGTVATDAEARNAARMMEALGAGPGTMFFPLAIGMRSLSATLGAVAATLEEGADEAGLRLVTVLEGTTLWGCYCAAGEDGDLAAFERRCRQCCQALANDAGCWTQEGRATWNARGLLDICGTMRAVVAQGEPAWGECRSFYGRLLERFALVPATGDAAAMLQAVLLGEEALADRALLEAVAACFRADGRKTAACANLGVQRQTLYNRLDKVSRLTGVDGSDPLACQLQGLAAALALCGAPAAGSPNAGGRGSVSNAGSGDVMVR